jgi:hypothetical protein
MSQQSEAQSAQGGGAAANSRAAASAPAEGAARQNLHASGRPPRPIRSPSATRIGLGSIGSQSARPVAKAKAAVASRASHAQVHSRDRGGPGWETANAKRSSYGGRRSDSGGSSTTSRSAGTSAEPAGSSASRAGNSTSGLRRYRQVGFEGLKAQKCGPRKHSFATRRTSWPGAPGPPRAAVRPDPHLFLSAAVPPSLCVRPHDL